MQRTCQLLGPVNLHDWRRKARGATGSLSQVSQAGCRETAVHELGWLRLAFAKLIWIDGKALHPSLDLLAIFAHRSRDSTYVAAVKGQETQ